MTPQEVEKNIGYVFKDKELLRRALTLISADPEFNNQTLEFFGDAIIEFVVSEHIYGWNKTEGELTELRKSIVSDKALAPVAGKLGLNEALIKSVNDVNNKKALPSAYEALVAAIYFDGGLDEARSFVVRTIDFTGNLAQINYKGKLQELLQRNGQPVPNYVRTDAGTPRNPVFIARLTYYGRQFEGVADNVRTAEQIAAGKAYNFLRTKIGTDEN